MRSVDYRKIYKKYHGTVPKDGTGRSYDIHHIDGDHSNNSISNLVAIPINEHYEIHKKNGDYQACVLLLLRMDRTIEEISEMRSKAMNERVKNGTHPTQLKVSCLCHRKTFSGFWNFEYHINGDRPKVVDINKKRVEDGTHHWFGPANNKKRVEDGTHNLLGGASTRKQLADGVHSSQVGWCCLECQMIGRGSGTYTQHQRAHDKKRLSSSNA